MGNRAKKVGLYGDMDWFRRHLSPFELGKLV